jgi:hypothetical protein
MNLKNRKMSFEIDTLCMVTPLDPYESDRYNEPMDEDVQISVIENIYNITGCWEDYTNPIANGELSWIRVKSYDMDYEDAMERWKHKI